jgi:integrase/recombinase XerD
MTDQAMSPLRRRMIEDMTMRKLAPKTQPGYIRTIRDLAAFLGRSPPRRASRTSETICVAIGSSVAGHPNSTRGFG